MAVTKSVSSARAQGESEAAVWLFVIVLLSATLFGALALVAKL